MKLIVLLSLLGSSRASRWTDHGDVDRANLTVVGCSEFEGLILWQNSRECHQCSWLRFARRNFPCFKLSNQDRATRMAKNFLHFLPRQTIPPGLIHDGLNGSFSQWTMLTLHHTTFQMAIIDDSTSMENTCWRFTAITRIWQLLQSRKTDSLTPLLPGQRLLH
jgi:hypothetical protein